jgi:hypothetical protein
MGSLLELTNLTTRTLITDLEQVYWKDFIFLSSKYFESCLREKEKQYSRKGKVVGIVLLGV